MAIEKDPFPKLKEQNVVKTSKGDVPTVITINTVRIASGGPATRDKIPCPSFKLMMADNDSTFVQAARTMTGYINERSVKYKVKAEVPLKICRQCHNYITVAIEEENSAIHTRGGEA